MIFRIFPHQIEKIKADMYDMTIAIDCLHEMDKSTLKFYFKNITLISKNLSRFGTKPKLVFWGIFKRTEVRFRVG